MLTSLLSLFVSNCQYQICISFSQSLSASSGQPPCWRQVPFITLWVNFTLEDSNQPMLHVHVCLIFHAKVPFALPLSFCLTWKMRLLPLEMVITSDLDFFEAATDIPVGSSCSESLALCLMGAWFVLWYVVGSHLNWEQRWCCCPQEIRKFLGDVSLWSFV